MRRGISNPTVVAAVVCMTLAVGSCGQAAPPGKVLTPVQVGPVVSPPASDGQSYLILNFNGSCILLVFNGTVVTQLPATVINLNGPGPTPTPQPPNARADKYRNLALSATDPDRAATARKLAAAYSGIATGSYSNLDDMATAAIKARAALITEANWATQWQSFRLELTNDWTALRQLPSTLHDGSELFKDASAGLLASAP